MCPKCKSEIRKPCEACAKVNAQFGMPASCIIGECDKYLSALCGYMLARSEMLTRNDVKPHEQRTQDLDILLLEFINCDSWGRPVYKTADGKLFCDVSPRKGFAPEFCTKSGNKFDGEPSTPISEIDKYKNLRVVCFPKRVLWD